MYKFGTGCYLGLRLLQPASVNCAGLSDYFREAWPQREDEAQPSQRLKDFNEPVDSFLKLLKLERKMEKTCDLHKLVVSASFWPQ